MLPWRSTQVIGAFVAGLAAITATREGLIRAGAPLGVAWLSLMFAGASAVLLTLLFTLVSGLSRNRVRRAARRGRSEVRTLCEGFLATGRNSLSECDLLQESLFLDDPASPKVIWLQRALAGLGVRANAAEVREYLFWCRLAKVRAGHGGRIAVPRQSEGLSGRRLPLRQVG